jgi:hypothetical protein
MMRSKILLGVAAPTLAALTFFTMTKPASAQWYGRAYGWGPAAVAAGVVGGVVAAATSPLWAPGYYGYYGYPGYAYGPAYGYETTYGYGPSYGYSSYGYSYGAPGVTYSYGYGPSYAWNGAYGSAAPNVTVTTRRGNRGVVRHVAR